MNHELRKPFIAGNWKMNMNHKEATLFLEKFGFSLKDYNFNPDLVEIFLGVPFTDIRTVQTIVDADKLPIKYGSEDISDKEKGAYTGEISGSMLKELGCSYAIIGHSERRKYHQETVQLIIDKCKAALANNIIPVLCVGDVSVDDNEGTAEDYFYAGVQAARDIKALGGADLDPNKIVIAWEPAAAIGSGAAVEPSEIKEVSASIREKIAEVTNKDFADKVRILYGGSANDKNVGDIMVIDDIDGLLIGGAALIPEKLSTMVRVTEKLAAGE
jgi:triosephosphate isomerase